MALLGLFRRKRHERAGFALYTRGGRAPRATPIFYAELGVPDTLDGRFDMIGAVCLPADPIVCARSRSRARRWRRRCSTRCSPTWTQPARAGRERHGRRQAG